MKKVCKKCKFISSEEKCPVCGSAEFSDTWKGRIFILNPQESEIAKQLKIEKEGTYAILIK